MLAWAQEIFDQVDRWKELGALTILGAVLWMQAQRAERKAEKIEERQNKLFESLRESLDLHKQAIEHFRAREIEEASAHRDLVETQKEIKQSLERLIDRLAPAG